MKHTTVEQELCQRGRCLIQTVGVSMEPILHNRYSTAVLERKKSALRRGDVVLFRRTATQNAAEPCEYVLHRIIGVKGAEYLLRGDNCLQTDICREDHIIGVMIGFFNGDHYTDCSTDRNYARYMKTLRMRYVWRMFRAFCGKVLRFAVNVKER